MDKLKFKIKYIEIEPEVIIPYIVLKSKIKEPYTSNYIFNFQIKFIIFI